MERVRPAEIRDIPTILELLVQVDMVHHNGRPDLFKGPVTKYTAKELEEIFAKEDAPVFVCVDESDRVLGHAFTVHKQIVGNNVLTDVRTLYIDDICVDEAARGQGVGKEMICLALKMAFEILKAEKVTLGVFENNPAAYHCYKAAGFREDPAKPPAYYPLLGESWKCIDLFIERPENHP